METDFPKSDNKFIKADMFQDQELPLTYKGWEKHGNEDRTFKGKTRSWKENLKFQLRYSYPEYAIDEAGEKRTGKDGKPFTNRFYDPKFPKGYTIRYFFEEGQFESGSLPLWNAFCMVRPKVGDLLVIGKTGKDKETKWKVKATSKSQIQASINERNSGELPDIQLEPIPFENSDEVPF